MEATTQTSSDRAGDVTVETTLPGAELEAAVDARLERWVENDLARRLWSKDPSVWAPGGPPWPPELADRLGWLDLPERAVEDAPELVNLAEEVRQEGFERVVLLGMGGSSLAPEVFQAVLGGGVGFPVLVLLDSTHPEAVRAVEETSDLERTLFVVASKSGTTVETLSLFHYFWDRVGEVRREPGRSFVAVTDPGTPLADLAGERRFRGAVLAPPEVGGRYSALSPFGLLPAALIGLDVERIARGAVGLLRSLRRPPGENSGLRLGALLAEAEAAGRDKLTFLTSPPLEAVPVWIEQLVAESTGKQGHGLVPVVGEPPLSPEAYGPDRLFVHLALEGEEAGSSDPLSETMERLVAAGHPVARTVLPHRWEVGAAMLLWEVAVAAAGAALGIQPFDQPDVELAKRRAKEAMAGGAGGAGGTAGVEVEEVSADDPDRLEAAVAEWLRPILRDRDSGAGGRYLAIQAFLPPDPQVDHAVRELRAAAAEGLGMATTFGYGPRFLHSTGQLHKGGPGTGLFLQLVDDAGDGVPIPGSDHGFGDLVRAQALGDYRALVERDRRVLRVRVTGDRSVGLAHLRAALAV